MLKLVQVIAGMDPVCADADEWSYCFFCGASLEYSQALTQHAEDCLWRKCYQEVYGETPVAEKVVEHIGAGEMSELLVSLSDEEWEQVTGVSPEHRPRGTMTGKPLPLVEEG